MANQAFVPNFRNPLNNNVPFPQLLRPKEPSLFESLAQNLRDALFPEKLPPLKLTSRPVAVRDIWEKRDPKRSVGSSLLLHAAVIGSIILLTYLGKQVVQQVQKKDVVTLVAPDISDYMPMTKPGPVSGGGGGGGDVSKVQAPKGHLPKVSVQQITPPAIIVKNDHPKLTAEPSIMAPNIKLPDNKLPTLGDPIAKVVGPMSNGTGVGGGIGSGSGGGIGVGTGTGLGNGSGMGFGGGVYKPGGGVAPPKPISQPEPDFSEEARKAKYQGVVVLSVVVDRSGHTNNIRVTRPLGMGLDQKAIEAVRKWVFQPATKNGNPVNCEIQVEVSFTLM